MTIEFLADRGADAKKGLHARRVETLEEMVAQCDVVTVVRGVA